MDVLNRSSLAHELGSLLKPGSPFNDMHRHIGIGALGHYGVVMDLSSPRTSLHAAWGTGSEEVVDCLISLSLMGMGYETSGPNRWMPP